MSSPPIRTASFLPYEPEDLEMFGRFLGALTIHPITSVASYFLPFWGAYLSGYTALRRGDPAQRDLLEPEDSEKLFAEIDELKKHAGIKRDVAVYEGSICHFHNYGGRLSLTAPLIAIPFHLILRPRGPNFGAEQPEHNLKDNDWRFSDDETRFFIASELGRIKENDTFLRLLSKIVIFTAAFFLFANPYGLLISIAVAVAAIAIHLLIDRHYQGKMDLDGVKILGKQIGNIQAHDVAIRALEKIQKKNEFRRDNNDITKLYMTRWGDNLLDITAPLLSTRISRLQKHLDLLKKGSATNVVPCAVNSLPV